MSVHKEGYTALSSRTDEEFTAVPGYVYDDRDKFRLGAKRFRYCRLPSCVSVWIGTLVLIVLFQTYWLAHLHWQIHPVNRFSYSKIDFPMRNSRCFQTYLFASAPADSTLDPDGLDLLPTRTFRGSAFTKFMSEDVTEANAAWDLVESGHGDVAIEPQYAFKHGLPPTIAHPKDNEKLLYIIAAYHAIHCIVSLPPYSASNLSSFASPHSIRVAPTNFFVRVEVTSPRFGIITV